MTTGPAAILLTIFPAAAGSGTCTSTRPKGAVAIVRIPERYVSRNPRPAPGAVVRGPVEKPR